jgi:hypothetical protein
MSVKAFWYRNHLLIKKNRKNYVPLPEKIISPLPSPRAPHHRLFYHILPYFDFILSFHFLIFFFLSPLSSVFFHNFTFCTFTFYISLPKWPWPMPPPPLPRIEHFPREHLETLLPVRHPYPTFQQDSGWPGRQVINAVKLDSLQKIQGKKSAQCFDA